MDLQTPIKQAGRAYSLFASRAEKLGIGTLEDLLFHFPFRYDDYSIISSIGALQEGETVTVRGTVLESKTDYTRRNFKIQKVTIQDTTGTIQGIWFNQVYVTKNLQIGDAVSIAGRVDRFGNKLVIMVKDYEKLTAIDAKATHTEGLVPVYHETRGLSSKWIRNRVLEIINSHHFEEYMPDSIIKKNSFISFNNALRIIHFPENMEQASRARTRLAFDELFLSQLKATQRRAEWEKAVSTNALLIDEHRHTIDTFVRSLPFELTNSQKQALEDIFSDLRQTTPMNRLLEGDVGSGKTIVASIGMYLSYLNGFESALMAPTDILANQHYKTLSQFLEPLGLKVLLYTSASKKKMKEIGEFDIVVGTHALLDNKLTFSKLGLVVIDEQQRFGVEQRSILRNKGTAPHFLTMTATPIPRTVFLTIYGDLDVSYLTDMPKGRKRIKTWVVPELKRDGAYAWIRKKVTEKGSPREKNQVFIVCPFIEESESSTTVKAAVKEYEHLSQTVFPDLKLGLLHGKVKSTEKDQILTSFREGKFDILVATPVVEVGIDIPNATIMMIEASDRFGLAQLHQLRGRVGRNDKESFCLLFSDSGSPESIMRLKHLERIYNGAELAEIDLKLRGPGDVYGTMQHGVPKLKIASFSDRDLIEKSRDEAQKVFQVLHDYPLLQEKLKSTIIQSISPD